MYKLNLLHVNKKDSLVNYSPNYLFNVFTEIVEKLWQVEKVNGQLGVLL